MDSLVARRVDNGYHWSGGSGKGLKPYIIGIIVAAVVLLILAAGLITFCCVRRRRSKEAAGAGNGRGVRSGGLFGRLSGYAKLGDREKPKGEEAWSDAATVAHAGKGDSEVDMEQETGYHGYSDGGAHTLNRSSSGHSIPPPYNVAVQGTESQGADITDSKIEYGSEQQAGGASLEVSSVRRPRANSRFIEQIG